MSTDKQAIVIAVVLSVALSSIIVAILCASLGMHEEQKLKKLGEDIRSNVSGYASQAVSEIRKEKTSVEANITAIRDAQREALQAIEKAKKSALSEIERAKSDAIADVKAQVQVLIAELQRANASTVVKLVTEKPSRTRVYHILFNMTPDFGLRITDKPANATIALYINNVLVFNKTFHWPSVLYQHYPPYIANITIAAPYIAKVALYVDAQLGNDEHIKINNTVTNPFPPTATKLRIIAIPHLAPVIRHVTLKIEQTS
jgi:hypothetical protein